MTFLGLLTLAIFQATVGPVVGVFGVVPDLVLVLVVAWAMVYGSVQGMIWGLLGGISLDVLSGAPLGTHVLALTLIGYTTGIAQRSPFHSQFLLPLVVISIATGVYHLIVAVVLRTIGWPLDVVRVMADVIAPTVMTNAILMPIFYGIIWHAYVGRGGLRPEF